ncbi:hypothetical protein ACVBAX_13445 [Robertmurraya sp. GLU-23]
MENKELLDYDYEDRKFLKIVENGTEGLHNMISISKESILPAPVKLAKKIIGKQNKHIKIIELRKTHSAIFPGDGLPKVGQVYICNPIDTRRYYEVDQFHKEMVDHKIFEAEYLLRSLGATTIEITNETVVETKRKANASYNGFVKGDFDNSSNKTEKTRWRATYTPIQEPFIPEDLTWFDREKQWEMIANSRLYNGLETFTLEVEMNEDFGITSDVVIPLKQGIVSVSGEFGEFKKSKFTLVGEFKPL